MNYIYLRFHMLPKHLCDFTIQLNPYFVLVCHTVFFCLLWKILGIISLHSDNFYHFFISFFSKMFSVDTSKIENNPVSLFCRISVLHLFSLENNPSSFPSLCYELFLRFLLFVTDWFKRQHALASDRI